MGIETTMLYKLRFQQQAVILATEVSSNGPAGIADILAIKNDKVYEYEVKRSKSDFKNDFNKCSHAIFKHDLYNSREEAIQKNVSFYGNLKHFVPDYFYFVVTTELGDFVLDYLKKNQYDKYGLITVHDKVLHRVIYRSTCVRRAKQLKSVVNIENTKNRITARLSSELVNAKMDLIRNYNE